MNLTSEKINKNQIFILSCPASLPFFFARHLWFVVEIKGKLSRYEVIHSKNIKSENLEFYNDGYVYKNLYPFFEGISIFPWKSKIHWKSKLESVFEIDERLSSRDIDTLFLEYKNKDTYALLGPNSNTYVASMALKILKKQIKLPFTAIGKNYTGK
jgi:hypothetical protein